MTDSAIANTAPRHQSFDLIAAAQIPEINADAFHYRHVASGAELLSVVTDDENKVFSINFRTPPTDSTGVAHILEHAVLNGSKKYPLKEPFVELIKGSLSTFVNAYTYPDKTCYPVASQNEADFYNLIDVYLDAVLHPLLPEHVFEQEGWHLEIDDESGELKYSGVVFNEMKGSYSSPDRRLFVEAGRAMFPDSTYGVDSGGDPRNIPDLTYEQFKAFHDRFYHPSNARIFFWGDDDPARRLGYLDEWLREYERREPDSQVALQPRFEKPRRVEGSYPAGPTEDKGRILVGWVVGELAEPVAQMEAGLLESVLFGTPASPLRKALTESGLGEDVIGGGYNFHARQVSFTVGMRGVPNENLDAVEQLVFDTLEQLAEEGFDDGDIEAAINSTEFALREMNTGSFPRGLELVDSALTHWLYDRDPLEVLGFEAPLQDVKSRLTSGQPIFENLVRAHLIDNPHRVTTILRADPEMGTREEEDEKDRLATLATGLGDDERKEIAERAKRLRLLQDAKDSPEVLAKLPSLSLDDLDRDHKRLPNTVDSLGSATLLHHDLFTSGITYLDVGFDLRSLDLAQMRWMPLLGRAMTEMGTDKESYIQLAQRIGQQTGGLHTDRLVSARRDRGPASAWFFLRGKAMAERVPALLDIASDVLTRTVFADKERFRQLVLENKAGMEGALAGAGHAVVSRRLRAGADEVGRISEELSGIRQLEFIRQLATRLDDDWDSVVAELDQVRRTLLSSERIINLTADADARRAVEPHLATFLETLPGHQGVEKHAWTPLETVGAEGLSMPAKVFFVAKGANLYQHGCEAHGANYVAARYLRTTWLWEQVRVKGGAYGAFSSLDSRAGWFAFISYRDPAFVGTLANYDKAPDFLQSLDISERELQRAIIGAVSDLDSYMLPDAKGYTAMVRHLVGDDDDLLQQRRDEVLGTTVGDLRRFGRALEAVREHGRVVALGPADGLNAANQERGGNWLTLTEVL